jgi:hypothetical protein
LALVFPRFFLCFPLIFEAQSLGLTLHFGLGFKTSLFCSDVTCGGFSGNPRLLGRHSLGLCQRG